MRALLLMCTQLQLKGEKMGHKMCVEWPLLRQFSDFNIQGEVISLHFITRELSSAADKWAILVGL